MADPQSPNKFLYVPSHGADVDTWDVPLNANWNGLDKALGGYTTLNANGLSGTIALTSSQTIPLGFIVTGTPSGSINYQTPAGMGGIWLVRNRATLGASITIGFSSVSGGATVNIPSAKNVAISADGTASGMDDIDTVPTSVAGGSNTQVQVNIAGVLGAYAGFTFDGTLLHVPGLSVDGNAAFGTGAGSTMTVNGTAISAPNGFNFNTGAFQMNAAGEIGIGAAPTTDLVTVGGVVNVTTGGVRYPDGKIIASGYQGQIIQQVRVPVTSIGSFTGTYSTVSGAAPTSAGGIVLTPFSTSFTPLSATSVLEFEIQIKGTNGGGQDQFIVALFRGSTLIDFGTEFVLNGGGVMSDISFSTWLASPGTSAQALTLRIGSNSAQPFLLNETNNGAGGTQQLGMISWLVIKEIQPTT